MALLERLAQARQSSRQRVELTKIESLCRQLLSERGEANSVAIAQQALEAYQRLDQEGRAAFFDLLAAPFDPDPGEVLRLAEQYAVHRGAEQLIRLARAAEPPRQELLRRLNRAPGGTAIIVQMREKLLERLKHQSALRAVDADFEHLLGSWFNPGFLTMRQLDWGASASLLERIIQHEAVHAIDGWNDLRRRLQPDRRLFAFFHPMLPEEPLIFVEVALLEHMPSAIGPLLDRGAQPQTDARRFKLAAFYSISNCQPGLRGVNLGNFLIKRVAQHLQKELPALRTFCTLSPIPSFMQWLTRVDEIASARLKPATVRALNDELKHVRSFADRLPEVIAGAADHPVALSVRRLCAFFLVHRTTGQGEVGDPVARFHLNNGASLDRIHSHADLSRKGLKQSAGLMVNYLYDLEAIEDNHQRFVQGEVVAGKTVQRLIS